jgi:prepilin-type N-terminal cleavage/methylation domain-containing protein
MQPRLPTRSGGFTLVEILVVVAIIGVLAALGLGASGTLLDRGADAQDLSNLRQIGTAISRFAAENDNRWPNASIPIPGDSQNRSSFMESVDRYFERDSKFSAGSIYNWQRRPLWFSKRFAQMPKGASFNASSQYFWGTAWGINSHLWGTTNTNIGSFDGRILKAPNISKLVLVGEKNRNAGHDFRPDESPTF